MAQDQRFRKHERLRSRSDFARVFARKCSVGNGALVVYVAANGLTWSRLGLAVGKRVGGAVRRNYVRRRIREAFRQKRADLPKGYDIICVALPRATDPDVDLAHSACSLVVKAVRRCHAEKNDNRRRTNPDAAVT